MSHSHPPHSERKDKSFFLTNLDVPMPLARKLYLLSRNIGLRLVHRSTCCGHDGEPGC